ncbi:MOSC domain-containing protein [Paenibacillus glycanilyticus]|uniref:MOSC domain-containing protein n=1 Tax=Paenibacillus glycanilyticus TaxID=126569 RepID=UPI00203F4397|nr:MOSC domain-containing protein [Paenibacillus glycanilyticus]MCM3628609.1 MOSC domain-containing protein [Paenibacillus glycanilyticus]
MNRQSIGYVSGITQYPVKSLAGNELEKAVITPYGLYGDRSHAFVDETKEGWNQYITAREVPMMLGLHVVFQDGEERSGTEEEFPPLQITGHEGQTFGWNEELLAYLQPHSRRTMALKRYKPTDELLGVDARCLLIITDRTLARLEQMLGKPLDSRRFRANLLVRLSDDYAGDEYGWIGKQLQIGATRLEVVEPCDRCSLITLDPDTYARDVSILKKVNEEMGLNFGVYAQIAEKGVIGIDDPIYPL